MSDVRTVAKAFQSLGLSRFHGIGVLGPNCPEWFLSSAGAIYGGGLSVGIYATNSPEVTNSHISPVLLFLLLKPTPTNITSVHLVMGCTNARAGVKIVKKRSLRAT